MSTQETISYIDKDLIELNTTLKQILKVLEKIEKVLEKIEKDGIYTYKG